MLSQTKSSPGIFITFPGTCQKALAFYQHCFGGTLELELFEGDLPGIQEKPVIRGCLVSDRMVIHGSDLVHDEGRKIGNYMSVFLPCQNADERRALMAKLGSANKDALARSDDDQPLVEVTDAFDVRWVLSCDTL